MKKLSEVENTIANKIISSDLQHRMESLTFEEIKSEFKYILNEDSTSISKKTLYTWEYKINQFKSKNQIMYAICNLVLAADGYSLNDKKN